MSIEGRPPQSLSAAQSLDLFTRCVFDPTDIVEIRYLPAARSEWLAATALSDHAQKLTKSNGRGQNIYAGANPRTHDGGKKAEHVALARTLFADFDYDKIDESSVRFALANSGLPPATIFVHSGHGEHPYWRLSEPIADLSLWTNIQKQLIEILGSDKSIHDPPRIMRLPGFSNLKFEPVASCIVDADPDRRYAIEDLLPLIERKALPAADREITDRDLALSALAGLSLSRATEYLSWLHVGMALHSVDDNEGTLSAWIDWSRNCPDKFDAQVCRDKWASFAPGKITIGSLIYWAKQDGWRAPRGLNTYKSNGHIVARADAHELPEVDLPGGTITISTVAQKLGKLLGDTGRFYVRGGASFRAGSDTQTGDLCLTPLAAAAACSDFEQVARLFKWTVTRDGPTRSRANCSESAARLMLESQAFKEALPPLHVLSMCPVLVERGGELVQIVGYDRQSGIFAKGAQAPLVALGEAIATIESLFADFIFASAGDRARAFAALITPALLFGGLLNGRAPVDLGEADQSQAGKGFRNKLTAAIYNSEQRIVTPRCGGSVGSIQESFDKALVAGSPFISFDNLRGKLDLPGLESFLTENRYYARTPYAAPIEIDTRRVVVMLTSNKAEVTTDFANRASCVRILKQKPGYAFQKYPQGDLLDHVAARQPEYLGAVFAVIYEWQRRGKPQLAVVDHDFHKWAKVLGYIVESIIGAPGLLEGHRAVQERIASPRQTWLRDVALAIHTAGKGGLWLRPNQILDVTLEAAIETPGISLDADMGVEGQWLKATRAVGRNIASALKGDETIIDSFRVRRQTGLDGNGREKTEYCFAKDDFDFAGADGQSSDFPQ